MRAAKIASASGASWKNTAAPASGGTTVASPSAVGTNQREIPTGLSRPSSMQSIPKSVCDGSIIPATYTRPVTREGSNSATCEATMPPPE